MSLVHTRKLQVQYILCTQIGFLFWHSEQFVYTTCTELLSYSGLVDARISASDKDLPVSTCSVV